MTFALPSSLYFRDGCVDVIQFAVAAALDDDVEVGGHSLAAASSRCPIRVQLVCSCLFKPQSRRQRLMRSRPLLGTRCVFSVVFASIPLRYKLKTCTKPTLVRENASSLLFSAVPRPGSFHRCFKVLLHIWTSLRRLITARSRDRVFSLR